MFVDLFIVFLSEFLSGALEGRVLQHVVSKKYGVRNYPEQRETFQTRNMTCMFQLLRRAASCGPWIMRKPWDAAAGAASLAVGVSSAWPWFNKRPCPCACVSVSSVPDHGNSSCQHCTGPTNTARVRNPDNDAASCVSDHTDLRRTFLLMWASMQLTTHSTSSSLLGAFLHLLFRRTSHRLPLPPFEIGNTAWNLKMGSASLFFTLSPEGEKRPDPWHWVEASMQ